jgi:hypothetical protein
LGRFCGCDQSLRGDNVGKDRIAANTVFLNKDNFGSKLDTGSSGFVATRATTDHDNAVLSHFFFDHRPYSPPREHDYAWLE